MSVAELIAGLRSREIASVDLVQETFKRIDNEDQAVRAFLSLADRDEVVAAARKIDDARARRRSVPATAGIPIAVKDNIAVLGQGLTCGSKILENYVAPYDATSVERIKAAGLLIVGKTNMDEFGFGSSTENSAFFPTRNPRNHDRVPGGTSGGSAAAVAANFVPWALGTDTGGSVRQPAGLCGVVGLRPTYGRVSRYGLVAYASSMDQVGPITRSVDDAARLLSIISGPDVRDATTLPTNLSNAKPKKRVRVGVPVEYLGEGCQPAIVAGVEKVCALARENGWQVKEVSLPMTEYALWIYYVIAAVEAASNLARYDGVKYGLRTPDSDTYENMVIATRTAGFGEEAKRRIMLGTYAASAGYIDEFYGQAARARQMLKNEFHDIFTSVDILVSPISPTTAWPIGAKTDDPMVMYLSDVHSVPAALAGIPAIVLPVGEDEDGLPVPVQISGPVGADREVLNAAGQIEQWLASSAAGASPRA
jgi:aspartyl-tRNA(Asn)/glutamyl-tRNA(Gln) amidotransferase subunit A